MEKEAEEWHPTLMTSNGCVNVVAIIPAEAADNAWTTAEDWLLDEVMIDAVITRFIRILLLRQNFLAC